MTSQGIPTEGFPMLHAHVKMTLQMTSLFVKRCIGRSLPTMNLVPSSLYQQTSSGCFHTTEHLQKKPTQTQKGKSVQAQKWVLRQLKDPYVQRARRESYRCRSAFKLLEIDEKHQLLRPGDVVVDCGAGPGSWCEVAVNIVNAKGTQTGDKVGQVIGIDIQHMAPVEGATILYQTDFTVAENQQKIIDILAGQKADVILSDMAPNATGVRTFDHEIIIKLCLSALHFSTKVLRTKGHFLCKIWQGPDQARFEQALGTCFETVKVVKPHSSRSDSGEVFLLGKHFKGIPR